MLFRKPHAVVYVQQAPPTKLQLRCHRTHVLPVSYPMNFIGCESSTNGSVVARYKCNLCKVREGWVRDYATGKPRRLFTR